MKKIVTLSLAMAFVLGAAPIFAASTMEMVGPCVKPAYNTNDPNAVRNYESCMAEYLKAMKMTGTDREMAIERAESAMRDHERLKR